MTAAASITLRPISTEDLPLLRRIYASTRTEELAVLGWDEDQKQAFLMMQFEAQHSDYTRNYPAAEFSIIECDSQPAGRLYIDRRESEIRIIDIALLPECRGHGTGTFLLERMIEESTRSAKPLTIHVEKQNPALALYQRLGFKPAADRGVYWLMERPVVTTHTPPA